MKYPFYILDVFSPTPFGGNQLGMLPDARGISTDGMQKIAREFNFAETTFVFPPDHPDATVRLRIFTPMAEVDFAGHPTVGSACGLIYGGQVTDRNIVLEENVGLISVLVENLNSSNSDTLRGTLTNTTQLHYPDEQPDPKGAALALRVNEDEVVDGFYGSVGLDFCFIQLRDKAVVDAVELDRGQWAAHLASGWSANVFIFSGELRDGGDIYARMFAPNFGIEEDPATGSAVAALVGVAAKKSGMGHGELRLNVLQGVAMGRRSEMVAMAKVENGNVKSVSVGGATVLTAEGQIEVQSQWLEDDHK